MPRRSLQDSGLLVGTVGQALTQKVHLFNDTGLLVTHETILSLHHLDRCMKRRALPLITLSSNSVINTDNMTSCLLAQWEHFFLKSSIWREARGFLITQRVCDWQVSNLLVYLLNVSFFSVHKMEACLFLSMLSEFKNSIVNCFQRLVIGSNATIFLEAHMLKQTFKEPTVWGPKRWLHSGALATLYMMSAFGSQKPHGRASLSIATGHFFWSQWTLHACGAHTYMQTSNNAVLIDQTHNFVLMLFLVTYSDFVV